MNCPRCGTANSAGRRFCAECGSPLALACASRGFSNESGVKFCGKREQAHEHLAAAATMYREMDMRFWREQVQAALAELR